MDTQDAFEKKRARDQRIVDEMIALYYKGNHKDCQNTAGICPECRELIAYANDRVDQCPRTAQKTFCSSCPVHCYSAEMRERIRAVMRYSGPRMLFYHPFMAFWHLGITLKEKAKARKADPEA